MPSLSLGSALSKAGGAISSYVKNGLKLYMPYTSPKEVKFVGEGSTYFDGINDKVDCGDDTSLDITDDITLMGWVKPASAGQTAHLFGRNAESAVRNYKIIVDSNTYTASYYVGGTEHAVTSSTADTAGVWVHIALTRNRTGNSNILYINGVAEDTDTDSTGAIDNDDVEFTIGCASNDAADFTGSIKNVAIWNRTLSATEVQNVMYKTYVELNSYSGTLIQGLVSWWPLSDGVAGWLGSTALDNHGSNHGTGVNMTTSNMTVSLYGGHTPLIPRGFDNALTVQADAIGTGYASFDGSAERVEIAHDSSLNFTDALTMSAWFYTSDISHSWQGILDKGAYTTGGNKYELMINNAEKVRARLNNTAEVLSGTLLSNTWYHVCSTYDKTTHKLYIDGVLVDTASYSSSISTNTEVLSLGCVGGANNWLGDTGGGKLKNIALWGATLTQAQIQSIMEKTYSELTSSEKTNLVSWWGLDTSADDEHGDNDGTLA
jgi:hypothetical protein